AHNIRRIRGEVGLRLSELRPFLEAQFIEALKGRDYDLGRRAPKDLIDEAFVCARAHLKKLAPLYTPEAVQVHGMKPLPGPEPLFLHGWADVLAEGPLVVENKSSSAGLWTPERARTDSQMRSYRWLFAEGSWPSGAYAVAERGTGKT